MLTAQFPHREHELHHVAEDGTLIEAFGSDYAEGFEAKMNAVEQSLKTGEQMIVFYLGSPQFGMEIDFDGNEVHFDV